jgi:hypothetical protein
MKKNLPSLTGIILLLFFYTATGDLFSQTSGTFSFSVTTTAPSGSYGTENLLAIWIENSGTAFIKTKIKYLSGELDHMATWVAKSGQNVVDATTGPTRTGHGTVTFLWNGTDINSTLVPDGTYNVWLEMAWDKLSAPNSGKAVNSFSFTKGASVFNSTPANTANFLSLVLNWTPLTTGVEGMLESKDINVYPNPTSGILTLDFKNPEKECLIKIINETGGTEYTEKISDVQAGTKTLDLSRLQKGNYYCILHFPAKDIVFTIILVK